MFANIEIITMKHNSELLIAAIVATIISGCGTTSRTMGIQSAGDPEINVGYGTVKQSDLAYAVTSNVIEDNQMSGYTSIFEYMRGRVPGLEIGATAPGTMPTIRIRGINSINASTQPIFIVDGMETYDISNINPNDVKSVDVLKDASTSIYGVRGANGVIIITTKSGYEAARREAEAARQAKLERREAKKSAKK